MEENNINHSSIEYNFTSSADSYNEHALIQKTMADKLCHYLDRSGPDYRSILEIGCGTGYLSELLIKNNPGLIVFNDISPGMILTTERLLYRYNSKKVYITGDFNQMHPDTPFTLIASNAALQWMPDLSRTLTKIHQSLTAEGKFAFTLFIKPTFFELEESFEKAYQILGKPFVKHTLPLLNEDEALELVEKAGFNILFEKAVLHYDYQPSALDFLKSLQGIGASGFSENRPGPGVIRSMIHQYDKNHQDDTRRIRITYHILYCLASRKSL